MEQKSENYTIIVKNCTGLLTLKFSDNGTKS